MGHEATLYERLRAAADQAVRDDHVDDVSALIEASHELLRLTEYAGNADLLRAEIDVLKAKINHLTTALNYIAARRALTGRSQNEYEAGYRLATESCCDIADEALEQAK